MLIFAVVNWHVIGLFLSIAVSLTAAILSFIKGNKSDRSMEMSSMVQTTFEGQSKLNENLQKEVQRVGTVVDDCERRCALLQKIADEAKAELHQARTDLGMANAKIRKLSDREHLNKQEIASLKHEIADLQNKLKVLERKN